MDRRSFLRSIVGAPHKANYSLNSSSLDEWVSDANNPWDSGTVNHIYNRLGFGATVSDIRSALELTPSQLIDQLMDDRLVTDAMPQPPPGYEKWMYTPAYRGPDYMIGHAEDVAQHDAKHDLHMWWTLQMMQSDVQLRERLVMFWHNHFVVEEVKIYYFVHEWRYFDYLRRNAWGNFKQMVKDITTMPAMLKYLDGIWNEEDMINENYARELMELFTMGITDRYGNTNYVQDDVRNLAHSLVGWRFWFEAPPPDVLPHYFADYYFDFNTKRSIWGSEPKVYGLAQANDPRIEADVIDLLFERRAAAIAWHIAKKIYRNFIYMGDLPDSSDEIIQELADTLIASNWELKPVFLKLFKSAHFFDRTHRGAAIKSPFEFMVSLARKMELPVSLYAAGNFWYYGQDIGQFLCNPTNVKGWEGYRTWLNTATLTKRIEAFAYGLAINGVIQGQWCNPHTGYNFDWIPYGDDLVLGWAKQFPSFSSDVVAMLDEMNELMFAIPIDENSLEQIVASSGVVHSYEWPAMTDAQRILPLRRMIFGLLSAPEFQLA
ncbi:MAG TPA: DUF1800 family protein [Candidatus Kapabacteria bacterium]|nr:DUF1800 family protein [Candidatus Kapabacteria bacterium]